MREVVLKNGQSVLVDNNSAKDIIGLIVANGVCTSKMYANEQTGMLIILNEVMAIGFNDSIEIEYEVNQ